MKLLAGKPLLIHTLEQAHRLTLIDDIYVTTDSELAANTTRDFASLNGSRVSVISRPGYLATDEATTEDVLLHALEQIKSESGIPDYCLLLPVTSPLRLDSTIEELVGRVTEGGYPSGQTVSQIKIRTGSFTQDSIFTYDEASKCVEMHKLQRRYIENSAGYIFKPQVLTSTGRMQGDRNIGIVMQRPYDLDINDEYDWALVEWVMNRGAAIQ